MWLVIIFIVIAFIVILGYFSNNSLIEKKVLSNGGMVVIYETLIDRIKNEDPNIHILNVTNRKLTIGATNFDGSTEFTISQDDKSVNIEWKVKSQIFGDHRLAWEFPENLNQIMMFAKIDIDIAEKNRKILKKVQNSTSFNSFERERQISLSMIAAKIKCNPMDAKQEYFKQMNRLGHDEYGNNEILKHLQEQAFVEAKLYNMKNENTPSAIYNEWTIEWVNIQNAQNNVIIDDDEDNPF